MAVCENTVLSGVFSTLSCIFWIFAQLPQILENYKNKSASGISPSFLLLWFMGDFLSFTSCLMSDVVLKFQVYLSIFFLCNDVTLCFQYYYYNSVYPKTHTLMYSLVNSELTEPSEPTHTDIMIHNRNNQIHIRHTGTEDPSPSSSYNSMDDSKPSAVKIAAVSAVLNGASVNGLPLVKGSKDTHSQTSLSSLATENSTHISQSIGLVLAWGCTAVYCGSRCPQLYKNYKRKSVEGISPMLFGAALLGNFTYTLSILTSCEFMDSNTRQEFFFRELPYILGSSGTIVFDAFYFYQKYLYRNAGVNTSVMAMESWNDVED